MSDRLCCSLLARTVLEIARAACKTWSWTLPLKGFSLAMVRKWHSAKNGFGRQHCEKCILTVWPKARTIERLEIRGSARGRAGPMRNLIRALACCPLPPAAPSSDVAGSRSARVCCFVSRSKQNSPRVLNYRIYWLCGINLTCFSECSCLAQAGVFLPNGSAISEDCFLPLRLN